MAFFPAMQMRKRGRRGQIFSSDFVVSVVIFGLILAILIPLWSTLGVQIRDTESRKDMQAVAIAMGDLFMRSGGTPANWSEADVRSIGLANTAHELNTTKILRLREMEYNATQVLLGLVPFNFSLNLSESNGLPATSGVARSPAAYYSSSSNAIFGQLNGSGMTWDHYFGSSDPGAVNGVQNSSARHFYSGGEAEMLNAMLFNATAMRAYRTIIIENSGVARAQANLTAMDEFVQNGGRLIFAGQGSGGEILIDGLGMTPYSGLAMDGEVIESDWLFPGQPAGGSVSFGASNWVFYSDSAAGDAPIFINVADDTNASRGLIASWEYGRGRVYYITDINGSAGGEGLISLLQIAGEPLSYGISPPNTSYDIFNVHRPAVLTTDGNDGTRMVSMELLVWR